MTEREKGITVESLEEYRERLKKLGASPTSTARQLPTTGAYLMPDGAFTHVAFALAPALMFWETKVKPPAVDQGDMIDITNMFNQYAKTFAFQKLAKYDDITMVGSFDPDVIGGYTPCTPTTCLEYLRGKNQNLTVWFPTGDSWIFWGGIRKYEFGDHEIGKLPELTLTVSITNSDDVNNVEAPPVYVGASGT